MRANEREILDLLREDARYEIDDLARMADMEPETVEETVSTLESSGTIRGYQAVVDWDAVSDLLGADGDGERVRANVELNVTLDRETSYDDVAARLAKFPEVRALRLVSGEYDFDVEVEGESIREVSQFVSEKVAPVPEITQTVTHYVMNSYKESGHHFGDGDEDDRLTYAP